MKNAAEAPFKASDAQMTVHLVGCLPPHRVGDHVVLVDSVGVHPAVPTPPIGLSHRFSVRDRGGGHGRRCWLNIGAQAMTT